MPTIAELAAQQIHNRLANQQLPDSTYQPQPGAISRAATGANNFMTQTLPNAAVGFFQGVAQPIEKGLASGIRSIQATPEVFKQFANTDWSNLGSLSDIPDALHNSPAAQIMNKPISTNTFMGSVPTMQGSSIPQNLGTAAQAASSLVPELGLGSKTTGALAGGMFMGGGAAASPNATAGGVLGQTAIGAGLGAAIPAALEGMQKLTTHPIFQRTPNPIMDPNAVNPGTVFRGQSGENPTGQFFSASSKDAQNYASLNGGQLMEKNVANANLKPVTSQEMLNEMQNPETLKNYDGLTFKHPVTGQQNVVLFSPEKDLSTPESILKARTEDATPSYNKNMVSERSYVGQGKDIQNLPRVNEGKGILGKRTINANNSEIAAGKELGNLQNYPDKGTYLEKSQTVYNSIKQEAENLRGNLQAEDKANPLITDSAKSDVMKNVFNHMDGDARTAVMLRGKAGDLGGKAGISPDDAEAMFGKAPRSVLGKYGTEVADAAGQYNGTREGLLDLRQNLDNIYESYRGKQAWGSDNYNALDDMHKNVRDYLNQELHDSTTNTDVQRSLQKQTNLYRAKDVLDAKAGQEAISSLGRVMQKHPQLGYVQKILEREGIRIPLEAAGVIGAGYYLKKKLQGK